MWFYNSLVRNRNSVSIALRPGVKRREKNWFLEQSWDLSNGAATLPPNYLRKMIIYLQFGYVFLCYASFDISHFYYLLTSINKKKS